MFDFLEIPYNHELAAFGQAWCGPERYELHKETLVARYESTDDDDGQTVEIYCTAMPARFYTIRALAGKNSVGEPKPPFEFGTGSSMAELAADMGKAISEGMLGWHPGQNAAGDSTRPAPSKPVASTELFCPDCGREAEQDHNSFQCHRCEKLWPKGAGWEVRSTAGEITELRLALRNVMAAVGMFETGPSPADGRCLKCYGRTIAPGVHKCRNCAKEAALKLLGQNRLAI